MKNIRLFEDFDKPQIKEEETNSAAGWKIGGFSGGGNEPEHLEIESPDGRELIADLDTMELYWNEEELKEFSKDAEEIDEAADPLEVTSKDTMRIQDIMRKSSGNMWKAKQLAETMCKLIQDKWKALRRARAAEREGQQELANIFFKRAADLGF